MKIALLKLVIICVSLLSHAQESGNTITVSINNVSNDQGKVVFALHTKDTFMKADAIDTAESEIKDGKVQITFKDVPSGEYAIIALHDANENGRMDYQENGMPLEAYGTSNNPMAFGPPQYEDAKFTLDNEDLDLAIRF